jgi:hypothetical protein
LNTTSTTLHLLTEPRISQQSQEQWLTEQYLLPYLSELECLFLEIRHQLDPQLRSLIPIKLGKPYPLGQCLEISLAVQQYLKQLNPSQLPPLALIGYSALQAYLKAGGNMRRVWGDLRGQYFQNAFLLGTLYLDVSNDTVVVTKPKIELLPFDESGLVPIADYAHFARIAESYWQSQVLPNHLLPELAPFCPVIIISKQHAVRFGELGDYLFTLNVKSKFQLSQDFLEQTPLPEPRFNHLAGLIKSTGLKPAANPSQGRRIALENAKSYRKKRWYLQTAIMQKIVSKTHSANQALSKTENDGVTQPNIESHYGSQLSNQLTNLTTVKIDNINYDTDNLSDQGKQHLRMLQITEQEITRLNAQLAIAKTARMAYANALKAALR